MAQRMNITAIVQARMNSTRLPEKVMLPLMDGTPIIEVLLKRLQTARKINHIVLATSQNQAEQRLIKHVKSLGIDVFCGDEHNVLARFYHAAKACQADIIIRITADCPLLDGTLIDQCINEFLTSSVDYLSNITPPTYPDGLDIEICTWNALETAFLHSKTNYEKEHVTVFIQESAQFTRQNKAHTDDLSHLRWTLDTVEDYHVIKNIFHHFAPDIYFSWSKVLHLQQQQPHLFMANKNHTRNSGSTQSSGQKLWSRAKKVIPGGNMLLSKRPEMFLPEQWPGYYRAAKGCFIWDMDGQQLTDMSIMGVGTNILGYAHPEVDEAVIKSATQGNMSSLNCPEEVYLAEKLIALHPWADMVRFARTGGEANAIAIRIARAASQKDKIAICGYHGWHDWYLAANMTHNDSLKEHLLPGLTPNGVPTHLKNSIFTFNYNDYNALETLVTEHDIGIIKMEVQRNTPPRDNFLSKVRQLATTKGIILIFDECTSGFRETNGGLHKKYHIEPDMAVFGKALGNGYAITSIIGKKDIMQAAQSSFISSTFWTERIGPTAALKTLDIMQREESWKQITKTGLTIRKHWQNLADEYHLNIEHWGIPALTGFSFQHNHALYKSYITQEMLKKGFLAGDCIYVSTAHNEAIIERYFNALTPIFQTLAQAEDGLDINQLLEGPICHSGFKRLN